MGEFWHTYRARIESYRALLKDSKGCKWLQNPKFSSIKIATRTKQNSQKRLCPYE